MGMKRKIQILCVLVGLLFSLSSWADPRASVEWEMTSIDFGEVEFKKPVTAEFTFKNQGLIPMLIQEVTSSCGCTIAEYPKQPIVSGQEGKILVTYDAETEGQFSKTIMVYSNAEGGLTQLFIKGIVVKNK